eukprot:CAMPEP_0175088640 /NCGR_PEP_ID=MMETSP0086_2-20121207/353_1 /TAXON_ID=136419 /ORGANISM="Unknown Unknown, Strain D1" /LENGTH=1093 /DNA_ID=CAMNT_0016361081 /DNA_START=16 /DNA_END=3297 /DNA_ORIENTATION=+
MPEKKKEKKKGAEQFASEEKFVNLTPEGQLKDFNVAMDDAYYPDKVEAAWDSYWAAQGLYKADPNSTADPFVIVIPPPNVTGHLHLGHAITCSIEDAIVRWNRMSGKNTLWLPGTDHAGIATQVVVEKKLMKERQQTRHQLGREKFLEEVWQWKGQSGSHICKQLRMLGASVDWSREVFTMDDKLSVAVKEAFLRMHKSGLIYRANRMVSWSCALKTAISAIEVDHIEIDKPTMLNVPNHTEQVEFGVIHSFAYKLKDSDDEIVVATTRMETMLGDVAVAVHPDDERYKKFHGKKLLHPFIEGHELVVITDGELVDMNFGTGAVKITPAHDPNDFKSGERNKLPTINILDDDGLINENGGKFRGMKRFEVRSRIIEEMKEMGIYRGKAANPMSLGLCSRSKDIIEPVIRPQWWVNCKSMAAEAVEKVREGELKIMPKEHEQTWFRWLENIQEWCISRQLWWGHRIPAYHCSIEGKQAGDDETSWVVAASLEDATKIAAERFGVAADKLTLEQDPDVLDTWFSSGLFPFSTMNWPNEEDPDFKAFFPGQLLETGHDILFFWVARMVMMSLALTGKLPFDKVYLHAMVRDKYGRKMSKSLGNVIDPIDVITGITLEELGEKLTKGNLDPKEVAKAQAGQKQDYPDGIAQCGTDALRFGLLAYTNQGNDVNLDIQRVVAYRQFCNKLWQATKFALLNFDEKFQRPKNIAEVDGLVKAAGNFADGWVLNRLQCCIEAVDAAFKSYIFADCTTAIYNFWLYDLCDNYLEMIKPVVRGDNQTAKDAALATLFTCLEYGLKLLHPLMPFVTEELFHRLPGHQEFKQSFANAADKRLATGSLMVQPYPKPEQTVHWKDAKLEADFSVLKEVVHSLRSTKTSLGLDRKKIEITCLCETKLVELLLSLASNISTLSQSGEFHVFGKDQEDKVPKGSMSSPVNPQIELYINVAGQIDLVKETIKVQKNYDKLNQQKDALKEKMEGSAYSSKTPPEVQEEHKEKLSNQVAQLALLQKSIDQLRDLMTPENVKDLFSAMIKEVEAEKAKEEKSLAKVTGKMKPGAKINKKVQASIDNATAAIAKCDTKLAELQTKFQALQVEESKS